MSARPSRLRLTARCTRLGIGGLAAATFLAFAPQPASAASVATPGLLHSLGQPLAIQAAEAEPLLVRRHRRSSRRPRASVHFYFGPPVYAPPPYYYPPRRYYTPRPYVGGQCAYWHQRCLQNWGYSNSNYRGCMRYHGC
jgi:hypothetical protein